MPTDWINIGLAFIEGFALIISPCILPILPIILSGSLTGNKTRPIGIVSGFIITFTCITLFSRSIITATHLSQDAIRNFSFIILLLLGLMMVSTYLTEKFNLLTQRLTSVGSSWKSANNPESGFWGGLLFGGLVGIIWTPCAGPILAAVIVQVVIQHTSYSSMLLVIAFAIGAGLPMLLIALVGRKIMASFSFFRGHTTMFRQGLGVLIILTVLYLIFVPATGISFSTPAAPVTAAPTSLKNALEHPYKAPEIAGIDAWINSAPLNLQNLHGKVVLIDFWTYSCINCIRTLPYIKDWYAKYHDQGLEIIGVHSPEFQFEHDLSNVQRAVQTDGITYPVALDNNFTTWQNYQNHYWPAHYLINKDGDVVYVHFGEGDYDVTENNIRFLLGINESVKGGKSDETAAIAQTPETYLGYKRGDRFTSREAIKKDTVAKYTYPDTLSSNHWALKGDWMISADKIVSASAGAAIEMYFKGEKVYMVMGAAKKPIKVSVFLDGKPLADNKGNDVANGAVNVTHNQLYSLIEMKKGLEGHLEIIATEPGLEVYTFTFGA